MKDQRKSKAQLIEELTGLRTRLAALQASDGERRYRGLFEESRDAVYISRRDGKLLESNQAALDLFGYTREEMAELHASQLYANPDDRERFCQKVEETGSVRDYEVKFRKKNGIEMECLVTSTVRRAAGGTVTGYQGIIRDITARKWMERTINESVERFEQMAEHIDSVFWLADRIERKLIYVSPAYERIWGRSVRSAYDHPEELLDAIHSDDRDRVRAAVYSDETEGRFDETFRVVRPDESIRCVHVRGFPVRDAAGRISRIAGIGDDITEHKQVEEVLKFAATATAGVTGREFFRALTKSMASALSVPFAVAATYPDSPPTRVRTLAIWTPEGFSDDLDYDLVGTPCAPVVAGETRVYREGASALFPNAKPIQLLGAESYIGIPVTGPSGNVNGHLAVLDTKPMADTDQKMAVLEIFAARAGAELHRIRAEEALCESEERYRVLFENAPVGIGVSDADGNMLAFNDAMLEPGGYTREEVMRVGKTGPFYVDPERRAELLAAFERGVERHEVQFMRKDGTPWDALVKLCPITWGGGAGMLAIVEDVTERKQAEQALRRSEASLADAQTVAHVGSWEWDILANEEWWSDETYRIFGVRPEDFTPNYENYLSTIHPDDRETVVAAVEAALEENKPVDVDYRIVRPDGTERIVNSRGRVFRDDRGTPVRMVGICQDISEPKRREEALRLLVEGTASATGDEFFPRLVRSLADALHVKFAFVSELAEPEGQRLRLISFWAGTAYGETFEYDIRDTPCQEVVGKGLACYPACVQELFPRDAWLREAGIESYLAIPLFDADGRPLGHLGVMHDAPMEESAFAESLLRIFAARAASELERRGTEQALRQSEYTYRTLINQSPDPIFVSRIADFAFTEVNERACVDYGYTREEFLNMEIFDIETEAPLRQQVRDFYDATEVGRVVEVNGTNRRKDGSTFPVHVRFSKLDDELAIAVVRDITERKRLEGEVIEVGMREQRRIGQDLHDGLGQHLTGIALLSKALVRKLAAASRPEVEDAVAIEILVNAAVAQTRNLAKELHPTALLLGGLAVALEELASSTEQLFGVSCVVRSDGAGVIPDEVATQLYYIAQEAVSNAVKHGEARNIVIELDAVGNPATLAVNDDGVGFPDAVDDGPGLGLRIMRHRAGMIDASLDIRRGTGAGTVLVCSFAAPARVDARDVC